MTSDDFEREWAISRLLQHIRELATPPKIDLTTKLRRHPEGDEREAWQGCGKLVEKYDKEMCDAYREQIDTLLTFAGLFSAVVTAFAVDSYKWLHDDSGDATVQLLVQIANVLIANTTAPIVAPPTTALSDRGSVRINTCWFLSLTLSLASALVGILAKQWVREYERDAGRTQPEGLGIRQVKYKGFEAWRVNEIVLTVPLLLQAALALFLAGVVELLWRLNRAVAGPVIALVSCIGIFYLATTILPCYSFVVWYFTPDSKGTECPYKSPQAWLLLRSFLPLITQFDTRKNSHINYGGRAWNSWHSIHRATEVLRRADSWRAFDFGWTSLSDSEALDRPENTFEALAWLGKTFEIAELPNWIWHCLWPFEYATTSDISTSLSFRTESNISCILHNRGPHVMDVRTPDCIQRAMDGQPLFLFLSYSLEASLPYHVILELLLRFYQLSDRWNRRSDFCNWVSGILNMVNLQREKQDRFKGAFDLDVCDFYLQLLDAPAETGHPTFGSLAVELLHHMNGDRDLGDLEFELRGTSEVPHGDRRIKGGRRAGALRHREAETSAEYTRPRRSGNRAPGLPPSEQRDRIALATCLQARDWLQASLDVGDIVSRIAKAISLFALACTLVERPVDLGPLTVMEIELLRYRTYYDDTSRHVLCALADAIHAACHRYGLPELSRLELRYADLAKFQSFQSWLSHTSAAEAEESARASSASASVEPDHSAGASLEEASTAVEMSIIPSPVEGVGVEPGASMDEPSLPESAHQDSGPNGTLPTAPPIGNETVRVPRVVSRRPGKGLTPWLDAFYARRGL